MIVATDAYVKIDFHSMRSHRWRSHGCDDSTHYRMIEPKLVNADAIVVVVVVVVVAATAAAALATAMAVEHLSYFHLPLLVPQIQSCPLDFCKSSHLP